MKLKMLYAACVMCLAFPPAMAGTIEQMRSNLAVILSEESMIRETINSLDGKADPVSVAYCGMLKASLARYSFLPLKKLKLFNEGKDQIEMAVRSNPSSCEIRFLRLLIQTNAPGFLAYNKNKNEDEIVIRNALKELPLNDSLKKMIGSMMPSLVCYE